MPLMKYAVVIETGPTSSGATVPDLPGCVAMAETLQEVETLIQEGIDFPIESLHQDGLPGPSHDQLRIRRNSIRLIHEPP